MAMNLPELPQKDGIAKVSGILQLAFFLLVFIGILALMFQIVHTVILRLLVIVVDYIVTSLLLYVVVRPLMQKLENRLRKKK